MPVSVTSQLKVVWLPVSAAAFSVRGAWTDASAFKTEFLRYQVRVSVEVALVGLQLLVVRVIFPRHCKCHNMQTEGGR